MKVIISGASGLIGRPLVNRLGADGHDVVRLVRRPPQGPSEIEWDTRGGTIDNAGLEVRIPLSTLPVRGSATIAGRTRTSGRFSKVGSPARVSWPLLWPVLIGPRRSWYRASAIGWYGDRGDEILDETAAKGDGFLADVTAAWEAAAVPAASAGIRVVYPRTGIVLSKDGGALQRLLLPFSWAPGPNGAREPVVELDHPRRRSASPYPPRLLIGDGRAGEPHRPEPGHQQRFRQGTWDRPQPPNRTPDTCVCAQGDARV